MQAGSQPRFYVSKRWLFQGHHYSVTVQLLVLLQSALLLHIKILEGREIEMKRERERERERERARERLKTTK